MHDHRKRCEDLVIPFLAQCRNRKAKRAFSPLAFDCETCTFASEVAGGNRVREWDDKNACFRVVAATKLSTAAQSLLPGADDLVHQSISIGPPQEAIARELIRLFQKACV